MRALVCALSMALMLPGCELLEQLRLGVIDEDTEPAAQVSHEALDRSHGKWLIPLSGGRLLHGKPVLRVVDLHDPRRPRVAGMLDRPVSEGRLFQIGEHVIYATGSGKVYRGERDDVDSGVRPFTLLNVEISERLQPTVINEVALYDATIGAARTHLRQGLGQAGPAIFEVQSPLDRAAPSQVRRYELQGEQLVRTGQLRLPANVTKFEVSEDKLLLVMPSDDSQMLVAVVDGTGAQLSVVFETSLSSDEEPELLAIDGEQLRVSYRSNSEEGQTNQVIDTFDLTEDRTGRCEPGGWERYETSTQGLLLSRSDHTLYARDDNSGDIAQIAFDAVGNCPAPRTLSGGSSDDAMWLPDAQSLLTIGGSMLSLYDTAPDASEPLLVSTPLAEGYAHSEAEQPIHVFDLQSGATAVDGTPEPWLVAVPYYEWSEIPRATFSLFSASPRTLTQRSVISELAFAGDVVLYDSTLVTLSSHQLRTFDIAELEAPRQLGKLDIGATFGQFIQYGGHIVRVKSNPQQGPPEGSSAPRELQVISLDKTNEPPIATWLVDDESTMLIKVEELLLDVTWTPRDLRTDADRLNVQAYDLHDPTRVRSAAGFNGFSEPTALYSAHAVGASLVLAVRKMQPSTTTRECTKTISHLVCEADDPSGCMFEYWSGYLLCRTIDDGPESCELSGASHCVGYVCTREETYPEEAIIQEQYCTEHTEATYGPMSLAVIDYRDAERPVLLQPYVELPRIDPRQFYRPLVADNMFYHYEYEDGAVQATAIDCADPHALKVSGPHALPGPIWAATATDVYTADSRLSFTVSRIASNALASPPTAARSWPGRELVSIHAAGAQQLYITHRPSDELMAGADPRRAWTRLEVLDAQTLATVGELDIDKRGVIVAFHEGRVMLDIDGALLLVDVRDPTLPSAQAAVPYPPRTSVFAHDDRFYVLIEDRTYSYPIDLRNLLP